MKKTRNYELVLILDPDLTAEKRKKQLTAIKKIIEAEKGKIIKEDEWGKKELVYPIKKKREGYYFLWQVELPPTAPALLEKKLKLEEGLMRYLLVRKDEKRR